MNANAQLVDALVQDLQEISRFLRANDAGAQIPASALVEQARSAALSEALGAAGSIDTESQGTDLIQTYLRVWRSGHLFVESLAPGAPSLGARTSKASRPQLETLSVSTLLLTLPTFFPGARKPLADLLEVHRPTLASHPNWIIDVRGNDGGADTTYAPLLPWLVPDGWLAVSDRIFVTEANMRAEEGVCDVFAPGDAECIRVTQESVRRMRSGREGGWVQQEYDEGWRHERLAHVEEKRPDRVAVLMDRRCGSSCEQFLLTVRQSFTVKLVGRSRTCGVLDSSNLRPYLLPSGHRRLWYATTLSNRLPAMPIDGIGVCPDVLLPEPGEKEGGPGDVRRAQRWLEHGQW